MHSCILRVGVRNFELEATYGQQQAALQVACVPRNHRATCFFDTTEVHLLGKMSQFMRARAMLHELGASRRKSSGEVLCLGFKSINDCFGLLYFKSVTLDI